MSRLWKLVWLGTFLPAVALAQGSIYGELRLRGDDVDLPNGRQIERARLHGVLGWTDSNESLQWGVAARYALGSDENSDNVRNLDNEESSSLDLGELWLRLPVGSSGELELGQAPLPLWLTPLIWDRDFRPAGASYRMERPLADYDTLALLGGYWTPHHIDEHATRLAAVQASWRIREGAAKSGTVTLSYLDFSDLGGLVRDGRTRTNRVANGALVSDYELLNLTLQYRFPFLKTSALATLDLVSNLGADDQDQGLRFSFVAGNAWHQGNWEWGYAYHRIQRDAVMASFNNDDWWFPSWMRGWSPWLAYGISEDLRIRLAGFVERRDDQDKHLQRILLDLSWHF
jgi:hypothetical protein